MTSRRGARILLLGGDTDHNVGDRAILAATARCLATHDALAEITAVGEPGMSDAIPGIARWIRRGPRGMAALARTAFDADRILVAGGGLFQDDDSRAKMPYWAARIALLRLLNSRIVGHSIGAGPLDHVESRVAARIACAALSRISVRDRYARETLVACTARPIDVVPDPAFMLEPSPRPLAIDFLRSVDLPPQRPIVVAAVRRWYHARGGFVPNAVKVKAGFGLKCDERRFECLLDTIADALLRSARRLDAGVLLLPGYNVGHEADDLACGALARRLDGVTVRLAWLTDPRLYKAVVGQASLVVASRMHPLIFAAGMGVPLVGLSYNPKFDGLFELLELPARPLALDDFPDRWAAPELAAAMEAALAAGTDLRRRAESLAASVRQRTLAAAFGDTGVPGTEPADA